MVFDRRVRLDRDQLHGVLARLQGHEPTGRWRQPVVIRFSACLAVDLDPVMATHGLAGVEHQRILRAAGYVELSLEGCGLAIFKFL